MRFLNEFNSQIEKVASTEAGRYNTQNVFFNAERCHLVATNGHCLAIVHVVPEEGDVTGWITPEVMQAWRKEVAKNPYLKRGTQLKATKTELILTTVDGQRIFRRPEYRENSFPQYDAVIPAGYARKPAFTLDIRLLAKLVEALGFVDTRTGKSSMVAVFPSADNRGAHLVKTSQHGPLGIIMPVRADDEKSPWLTSLAAVDGHFQEELEAAKQIVAAQAARDAKAAEEEDDEEEEENEAAYVPVEYRSNDGFTFWLQEDGTLSDAQDPHEADLIYDDLDQLNEQEARTFFKVGDVCIAGSPAENGICGDPDCVCSRTAKPVVVVEDPVEPVIELDAAEPESEPIEEPVVAAEDESQEVAEVESQEVAEVAEIDRKPARKSRRSRKERAA
jgi:hypothetical protein